MSFMDFWKKLTPANGEEEVQASTQAAPSPSPQPQAPTEELEEPSVEEYTASGLLAPYIVPRQADYVAPRINIPEESKEAAEIQRQREKSLHNSLENLRNEYKAAQEEARSRQMKAEMLASLGNNAGTIIAGAQAMNTKANVSPVKTAQIDVGDAISRVDKNFKTDYDGLLEQYKALKGDRLSAKDRLYAEIAQAQLDAGAARMNANIENTDRNAGMRAGSAILKDQKENELSDKQLEGKTDIDGTLAEIRKITNEASKFKDKLGPNAATYEQLKEGRAGALIPGKIDPEYVKFRSNAKALQGQYQKIISGLTLSDQEREDLKSYIPNVEMPYESFMANAKAFEERVKEIRKRTLDNQRKMQGKNVGGYKQPASGTVRIQGPSGQIATVSAEAAEKYLSKPGYKKLD